MKSRNLVLVFAAVIAQASCNRSSPNSAALSPASTQTDLANPIPFTADSVMRGKELYHKADCALCHGKDGNGKGFLARDTRMNVHDWQDAAYSQTFTDGRMYSIILKGKDKMPAYETRNTPEEIWLMVDYIRSLSAPPKTVQ